MKIEFVREYPLKDTMIFEQEYEENLRIDPKDKADIIKCGVAVWMLVDGNLAGEIYGLTPRDHFELFEEELEDLGSESTTTLYTYSTTILKKYQGKGLGKILKAYFNGLLTGEGYARVSGHATSPAMVKINKDLGAYFGNTHANWFGTDHTAYYYEITLR